MRRASQDSYFNRLYLLVIIVATILFSRRAAYCSRAFVLYCWVVLTLLVISGKLARKLNQHSIVRGIASVFEQRTGICGCGILGQRPRAVVAKKGIEPRKSAKSSRLQDLPKTSSFMRGGLLTTDVDGGITLLNARGKRSWQALCRSFAGSNCKTWNKLLVPGHERLGKIGATREIEFQTPDGHQPISASAFSPLRSRDLKRSGYVFISRFDPTASP